MATPIKMLRLSKQMEAGTVVTWLKTVGEPVRQGEAVVEIETDKSVVELESPTDGSLLEVAVLEGDKASVGTVLGWIGQDGERPQTTASPETSTEPAGPPIAADGPGKVRASPMVRRLAAEHGIDLSALVGSGPDGRITKADVQAATASPDLADARTMPDGDSERVPLKGIRRTMAARMAHSARTNAPVTTVMDIDMGAVAEVRQELDITYTCAVVKATGMALPEHRLLNASLQGDQILLHKKIDVGVAVDSPRGMVMVTIPGADARPLTEIDGELRELSEQARQGGGRTAQRSTFTVTNSGVLGTLMFTPIINPPQSAVLGMGKVQEMPVVRDGQIVVRPLMYLCLTYDHRIIEGAEAVRFLTAVKEYLEDPKRMR